MLLPGGKTMPTLRRSASARINGARSKGPKTRLGNFVAANHQIAGNATGFPVPLLHKTREISSILANGLYLTESKPLNKIIGPRTNPSRFSSPTTPRNSMSRLNLLSPPLPVSPLFSTKNEPRKMPLPVPPAGSEPENAPLAPAVPLSR